MPPEYRTTSGPVLIPDLFPIQKPFILLILARRFTRHRIGFIAVFNAEGKMPVKQNFTKKDLDALAAKHKRYTVYDQKVNGLGILVQPTGHRAFFWFRKVHGQPTWKTLGEFPDLSIEQARARAAEMNTKIADWKARQHDGPNPLAQPAREPTLNEIVEDYCERRLASHAKNPTAACKRVRWSLGQYFSQWKNRRLSSISKKDVRNLHHALGSKHGHVTANRIITLLRTLINWAAKAWEWKGDNPASGIEPFPERSRERFLMPAELPVLFKELSVEPNRDLQHFVVIALFTGSRMADILSMKWSDVNLDKGQWRIPNPKAKRPYTVELVQEVVDVLKARAQEEEWVFPSTGKSGHLVSLKRGWHQLLKRCGFANVRIHDLRRTFASYQAMEGVSLHIIGSTLGHSSTASTEVYARLQGETKRAAAVKAAQAMLTAGDKK